MHTSPYKNHSNLIQTIQVRFEKNTHRHNGISWSAVQTRLESISVEKLDTLQRMEETGGEPDIIAYDADTDIYTFCDCAPESPVGRRSLCYDRKALNSRKEHKPKNCALDMATEIGIKLLTEEQYRSLQQLGTFDIKTSSWIETPSDVRTLGGALFADYRYGRVFTYHNGAESYYASRGFRGLLTL